MSRDWAATNGNWAGSSWAVRVPAESIPALAPLRRLAALGVSPQGETVWLRGGQLEEALDRQLRLIPGSRRFRVLEGGQLIAEGSLVPLGYLPKEPWHLLGEWLQIVLPQALSVSKQPTKVELRLVPSAVEGEPALLETTLDVWAEYVSTAPQWRIDRWSYVVRQTLARSASEGNAPRSAEEPALPSLALRARSEAQGPAVLVRGLPLPPLPGVRWKIDGQIAVPAGYRWSPGVDAAVLREVFQLEESDLALLRPAGVWEHICAADWVRATRSSVRRTRQVQTQP